MIIKMSLAVAASAVLVAGCSSSAKPAAAPPSSSSSPSVHGELGTVSTPIGVILTDSAGKTIYRFAIDSAGKSKCTGTCLQYWPPVPATASVPTSVAGVSAAIGSIMRPDGTRQLTVAGFPVYTYAADRGPGSTAGQGSNLSGGLWWVVSTTGAQITAKRSSAPTGGGAGGGREGGGY